VPAISSFHRPIRKQLLRFLRGPQKRLLRFLRGPQKRLLRFSRGPQKQLLRFLRGPQERLLRFSRGTQKRLLRYLKGPQKRLLPFLGGTQFLVVLATFLVLPVFQIFPAFVAAQDQVLRVTLPSGAEQTCPVEGVGLGLYISRPRLDDVLRAVDPKVEATWDASSGIYHVKMGGRDFSLFRDRSILLYNQAIIETGASLKVARGQVFIPLGSVDQILRRLDGVQSNAGTLLESLPGGPVPTPASGPGGSSETPGELRAVDISGLVESLRPTGGESALTKTQFEQDIRQAAQRLLARKTILIDPQASPAPSGAFPRPGEDPGPDLTFRVAKRCQEILSANTSLRIELTRDSPSAAPLLKERLQKVNTSGAKALICLRMDESTFPANAGYRLFTVHEAVDPEGRRYHAGTGKPDQLPPQVQYLPFENVSLVLARLLDSEMIRGGLVPARDRSRLAPYYLLKRAAMPSASVCLGYWSNPGDLARLRDESYVDSAAKSLAQGLILFDRFLEEIGLEVSP